MHVDIKDPEAKVILSKYYTNEGQFVFTTHTPGEHHICLSPNSTRWFSGGSRLVCRRFICLIYSTLSLSVRYFDGIYAESVYCVNEMF